MITVLSIFCPLKLIAAHMPTSAATVYSDFAFTRDLLEPLWRMALNRVWRRSRRCRDSRFNYGEFPVSGKW